MELYEKTLKEIEVLDLEEMEKRRRYLDTLLKTPNGLGKLEEISIQLAGINENYKVEKKAVLVMAGDNGVEKEGISAGKRFITEYVVEAMGAGEATINSLAKSMGADVYVVDLGVDSIKKLTRVINRKIMKNGTKNIRYGQAMTKEEAIKAIEVGIEMVGTLNKHGYNLIATGEMGIGNTTTSSAILKCISGYSTEKIVGRGSGINDETLNKKIKVVEDAIKNNNVDIEDPIDILHKLGGLDIAGIVGAYLGAAKYKIPIVIDGFISGIAAILAIKIDKRVKDYMIASHLSEEVGAKYIFDLLDLKPVLNLEMKLGEGSGAVFMFPIIEAAANLTNGIKLYPKKK